MRPLRSLSLLACLAVSVLVIAPEGYAGASSTTPLAVFSGPGNVSNDLCAQNE